MLNVGDKVRSKPTGNYGEIVAIDNVKNMVIFKANRTGLQIKASVFNFERITWWDKVFYSGRFWLFLYVVLMCALLSHCVLTIQQYKQ